MKMADIEESDPDNADKIIVYHGETYGTWIYQMILKAFAYPEAADDWLPLRLDLLNSNIEKADLLHLINHKNNDHHVEYQKIGMAIAPNLYATDNAESAWGTICQLFQMKWPKISGFSDRESMNYRLYGILRESFIPEERWEKFKRQKKLLNYFIQEKRKLYRKKIMKDFKEQIQKYFPITYDDNVEEFDSFTQRKEDDFLDNNQKELHYKLFGQRFS